MSKNISTMQNYPSSFADLQDQLDCAQRSLANLRKDIRIIVRGELQYLSSDFIAEQCRAGKQGNIEEVID